MLRGIYGDPERYVQQYWSRWSDGIYFTGDGAQAWTTTASTGCSAGWTTC